MKRLFVILAAMTPVLAAVTAVSFAQQPQATGEGTVVVRQRVMQGPEGAPPAPGGDMIFIASELYGGQDCERRALCSAICN